MSRAAGRTGSLDVNSYNADHSASRTSFSKFAITFARSSFGLFNPLPTLFRLVCLAE